MAEGILRDKAIKFSRNIEVDSAGTAAYHIGEKPDSRMIETALTKGINIADLKVKLSLLLPLESVDIQLLFSRKIRY